MTEQHFWTLISLKLVGEASFGEKEELTEFLLDRPEMQLRAATMENFWNAHTITPSDQVQLAFTRHLKRMEG